MSIMDIGFLSFFALAAAFCWCFSNHKGYFDKTVAQQGEAAAKRLFKYIKWGGYTLTTVFLLYLALIIFG